MTSESPDPERTEPVDTELASSTPDDSETAEPKTAGPETARSKTMWTEPVPTERRWPTAAGRIGRDVPISASRPREINHRAERGRPLTGSETTRWPGNATTMSASPEKGWACLAVQARQDPGR